MNAASLPNLWANCVERLKDRINNRSFWEAIELTEPVTIEGDALIVGMEPENYGRASIVQQVANLHIVNEVVEQFFGIPLKVRLIEGNTLADWELVRERDARAQVMRSSVPTQRETSAGHGDLTWESVIEQISRLYAAAPHRALPQGKARFANEALYLLVESMDGLYPDDAGDHAERSLARVLERIANASEIPAAVLAFELERLRVWRRSSLDELPAEE